MVLAAHVPGTRPLWPVRVQQRRTRGWRRPPGAVSVARPSRWGNPYVVGEGTSPTEAVELFEAALVAGELDVTVRQVRDELAGVDLMCWCPLVDERGRRVPCHADVLLAIANGPEEAVL